MEKYYTVRSSEKPLRLRPQESISLTFQAEAFQNITHLHFTGESGLFYQWKDEPDYQHLYRRIDDSLNTALSVSDHNCLDLSAQECHYPKIAYYKMLFPPVVSYLPLNENCNEWVFGISANICNLKVDSDGYLRFRAEVRYEEPGMDKHSVKQNPDLVFDIPFEVDTNGWETITRKISFPSNKTASVCFYLEGEHYSADAYFEAPRFVSGLGVNLLPSFAPVSGDVSKFNWYGCNLSKKEWPSFELALNGNVFFSGEVFERCHMRSEVTVPVHNLVFLSGENELTIKLTSSYFNALSYFLYDVAFLGQSAGFLVMCPKVVNAGKAFSVIVDLAQGDQVIPVSEKIRPVGQLIAKRNGLNAFSFVCDKPENDIFFTLSCGYQEQVCHIERCSIREEDGVITGTSDLVYVDNEKNTIKQHLRWYFENEIGNMITLRPTYRWCGTRVLDEALWHETATLLEEAGIFYAHMLDGRELPGCDANPSVETLDTPHFLGRQTHELDGSYSYWGFGEYTNTPSTEAMIDLYIRRGRTHADHMHGRYTPDQITEKGGRRYRFIDLDIPCDAKALTEFTVERLRTTRHNSVRHTGPSVLFKYFYQAGYDWTGAELMYSPTEIVSSVMRGAAKCYGKPIVGAHHAVQWSSTPHNTPERYRRYRLALYISYLQGIHEINTEEGLWHLEEGYAGFNRFSDACVNHMRQQQDFYRYTRTHSRTGEFYTPVGFLHGRYDAWTCFGRETMWVRNDFRFSDAEKGWDILKFFYPRSVLDSIYRHNCAIESQGYYTGTPWGNVDIIPIEQQSYDQYRLLIAPGYNCACNEDFDKLENYVTNGGTLMIGWPQCSVTTKRSDVVSLNHSYLNHPFCEEILGVPIFEEDSYRGESVSVATVPDSARPLLWTDSGRTMVYEMPLGKGRVIVINAREYTGNDAVMAAYQTILETVIPEILDADSVCATGDEDVQFVVYKQKDNSSHIYFMATDWFRDPSVMRYGKIRIGNDIYDVEVPFGYPVKAVIKDQVAVWSTDSENDVLCVSADSVHVQGRGDAVFFVAQNGRVLKKIVDFNCGSIQKFSL